MEAMNAQLMLHVQMKWAATHVIAKVVSVAMALFVKVGLDRLFTIVFLNTFSGGHKYFLWGH